MANTSPYEVNNSPVSVTPNGTVTLTTSSLTYRDAEQGPAELTFALLTAPTQGTLYRLGVALTAGSTFTQYDINLGRITYTNSGGTGTESIQFQVTDSVGGYVGGKYLTFTLATNTPPVEVINSGLTVSGNNSVNVPALNLLYGDAEQSDAQIRYTITSTNGSGLLYLAGTRVSVGDSFTQTDLNAGRLSYTSQGTSTTFGFSVADGAGAIVTGKQLAFTVVGTNSSPSEAVNTGLGAIAGTATAIRGNTLLYGDVQQADAQIYYTITRNVAVGTISRSGAVLGVGDRFTQADLEAGRVTYLAAAGTNATTSLEYQVTDGNSGYVGGKTFAISVSASNTAPVVVNDVAASIEAGRTLYVTARYLAFADGQQSAGQLTYTVSSVTGGTLARNGVTLAAQSTFTQDDINAGRITFTAPTGATVANGGFGYSVSDGAGGVLSNRTYTVNIDTVNTSPTETINTGASVARGSTFTLSASQLTYVDQQQPASQVTYTVTTAPAGTIRNNGAVVGVGGTFTQADIAAGRVSFTLDGDATGANTKIGFQVTDGAGGYVGGKSFLVSAVSSPAVIDVMTMTAQQGRATAGSVPLGLVNDVDGDGYRDRLDNGAVGSTSNNKSANFVWGTATGFQTYDELFPKADQGFIVANTNGRQVVAVDLGDINGDGRSELGMTILNGGPQFVALLGDGNRPAGTVNQYGEDVVNLRTLTANQGFIIGASSVFNYAGGLGDVNGDGIADFGLGVLEAFSNRGGVYVYYGSATKFAAGSTTATNRLDVSSFAAADGFVVLGATSERVGLPQGLGDINGDGYSDFAILDAPNYANGELQVIFGGPQVGTLVSGQYRLDITTLQPTQGFVIKQAGVTLASNAGDLNGDGISDFAFIGGGTVYVVFGTRGGFRGTTDVAGRVIVDLNALDGATGFKIVNSGAQVLTAGVDVNGDGRPDLQLGNPSANGGAGVTYTIYGTGPGTGASVHDIDVGAVFSDHDSAASDHTTVGAITPAATVEGGYIIG